MEKIFISHDLFDIVKRLKQIDKKYFILYNKKSQKFEVHYKRSFGTLELVLPFDKLDKRTIDLVLSSRVENKKKILKQMEENNQKLEREKNQKLLDEASFKAKEMMTYAFSKGDTDSINFDDTYKTKWI